MLSIIVLTQVSLVDLIQQVNIFCGTLVQRCLYVDSDDSAVWLITNLKTKNILELVPVAVYLIMQPSPYRVESVDMNMYLVMLFVTACAVYISASCQ